MATAVLLLAIVSAATAKYSGGSGTAQDPYQIATAADLIALGEAPADYDKQFLLTADIDLDPNLPGRKVFDKAIIAPYRETHFTGVFDGNGHNISHLTIKGKDDLGLFGWLGGEVRRLGVVDVNIAGSGDSVGGLVGNYGTVTQCFSTGAVRGTSFIGGLVGHSGVSVGQSYSGAAVSGNDFVGGLVGAGSTIHHCYATGAVSGTSRVGGLVGNGGQITQCYSTGKVGGGGLHVGGLAGSGPPMTRSFWDIQTSGQGSSAGGTGKTTAEMQDPNTFMAERWDFVGKGDGPHDIWAEPEGGGYPILWWQLSPLPELPRFSGGSGEPNAPYLVSTAWELTRGVGHNPRLMKCHFKLVNDLDQNGHPIYPIGDHDFPYRGVLDGNGHTISRFWNEHDAGVVGWLGPGGEVRNLGVADVEIIDCDDWAGALVAYNEGTVTNCFSNGAISGGSGLVGYNTGTVSDSYNTGEIRGLSSVGGLVGVNSGVVIRCHNTGTVSGGSGTGGLVGGNWGGSVTRCWSAGLVIGSGDNVGGLVGSNGGRVAASFADSIVTGIACVGGLTGYNGADPFCGPGCGIVNCYATGVVIGSRSVGGLVGMNGKPSKNDATPDNYSPVIDCYAYARVSGWTHVGGLIGDYQLGDVVGSFWDTETSGQNQSAAGTGKTTAEMQDPNTFRAAGWDFVGPPDGPDDIWAQPEGGGYPILFWQLPAGFGLPVFSGGTGEPGDPYRISTPAELNGIGQNPRLMGAHFELVNDIDLSGVDFHIIGSETWPFGGSFNGNGHTISHPVIIGEGCLGVFACLEGEVKNLGVVDVNIVGSGVCIGGLVGLSYGTVTQCYCTGAVRGYDSVGGLTGFNGGTVTECHSTCAVSGRSDEIGGLVGYNSGSVSECSSTGTVSGHEWVGGLVGRNHGTVIECHSTGAVRGGYRVGGLAGWNVGTVSQCYSTGVVTGGDRIGGLVGENGDTYGPDLAIVTQCYSTSVVSGSWSVGGLVGADWGTVTQCYSTGAVSGSWSDSVGGLVGSGAAYHVTGSFWDTQTSGQTKSDGGTGKTTAEMQTAGTFLEAAWDFVGETANGTEDIWWILEGKDYPRLWWEAHN